MMEFEEMQKIWNEQKGETMYAINEHALHSRIKSKKEAAGRRINKVEIALMLINSICAVMLFIRGMNDTHYWNLGGSAIMLTTVLYILYSRMNRLKKENTFDRSLLGELDHAIASTDSIIRLSHLMIVGYLLPFSIFYVGKMIALGASLDKWLLILGLYTLAFVLILWERKHCHIPRKESLLSLKRKLMEE